ncbi:hypothetical protein [Mesorhizobium caraganae]|uniref:hypothetical protein n=1 Tax=Mesorhizobium caraganae TaxID=483206 RepID=UPI003ED0B8C5
MNAALADSSALAEGGEPFNIAAEYARQPEPPRGSGQLSVENIPAAPLARPGTST